MRRDRPGRDSLVSGLSGVLLALLASASLGTRCGPPDANGPLDISLAVHPEDGTVDVVVESGSAKRFYMDCDCAGACSDLATCSAVCAPWSAVEDPIAFDRLPTFEGSLSGCMSAWSAAPGARVVRACAVSQQMQEVCTSATVTVTADLTLPVDLSGYRVFVIAGQSQAVGYSTISPRPQADAPERHWILNPRSGMGLDEVRWNRPIEPLATTQFGLALPDAPRFLSGPWTDFVDRWEDDPGEDLVLVQAAVSGTCLVCAPGEWLSDPMGTAYQDMLDLVAHLASGRANVVVSGILWEQGFQDGLNQTPRAEYASALVDFAQAADLAIRSLTGQSESVRTLAALPYPANAESPGIGEIRLATEDAVGASPLLVRGADESGLALEADGIHIHAVRQQAKRWHLATKAVLGF